LPRIQTRGNMRARLLLVGSALLAPVILMGAARGDDPDTLPQRLREATTKAAATLAKRHAKLAQVHLGDRSDRDRDRRQPDRFLEAQLRPLVALTLLRAGGFEERDLAK